MRGILRASLIGSLAVLSGCGAKTDDAATAPVSQSAVARLPGELGPQQILQRLLESYRGAKSYSDEAVVRLRFVQNGQPHDQQWPSSVRFQRPNQLALDAFQATVRCDGSELRATIEDEPTGNIDGQVLVRPAPKEIALKDLASDPLLYDILASQLRRQPIQLELLLESTGLAAAFGKDIACRRLADDAVDGDNCFRIEVPSPGGAFVFWIDQDEFLLRRLDYPAAALLPELAQDETVSDLALWAEIREVRLNPPLERSAFTLPIPPGAKRMQSFVVPPRPLPSPLFGKRPQDFSFTTLEGEQLTFDDLTGKVAMLVWYRNHEACRATLGQIAKVRAELADNENVAIYAVSTDPTTESHDDLRQVLASWEAELPILRDLEAFGDSVFHIQAQPTVVVLDARGRVQIFQTGGNRELASQLASIISRLLNGEDVAQQIVRQAEAEREEYERLVAAGGPQPQQTQEFPETAIQARSEPSRLKLQELWSCRELASPGNVYIVEEGDEVRLLVCDGVRHVAELDARGKLLSRHKLDIPPGAAVTYLRTGVDAEGRRWHAGSAPLSPYVFIFDAQWQTRLTYPSGSSPAPICDVQLANLDGDDGLALYLGFVGEAGLQALSLEGTPLWQNKTFPNVVSVAVAPPADDLSKPRLLVTGEDGTVLAVNRFGNEEPRKAVGKRPIARIAAARFAAATQAAFLGISGDLSGKVFAVGIDAKLREQWSYPLPPGIHQVPIEPITSGSLLDGPAGQWILAAPDGSIHVVSEDGAFTDAWRYGEALTGIAAVRLGSQNVLIVATQGRVTAWSIK